MNLNTTKYLMHFSILAGLAFTNTACKKEKAPSNSSQDYTSSSSPNGGSNPSKGSDTTESETPTETISPEATTYLSYMKLLADFETKHKVRTEGLLPSFEAEIGTKGTTFTSIVWEDLYYSKRTNRGWNTNSMKYLDMGSSKTVFTEKLFDKNNLPEYSRLAQLLRGLEHFFSLTSQKPNFIVVQDQPATSVNLIKIQGKPVFSKFFATDSEAVANLSKGTFDAGDQVLKIPYPLMNQLMNYSISSTDFGQALNLIQRAENIMKLNNENAGVVIGAKNQKLKLTNFNVYLSPTYASVMKISDLKNPSDNLSLEYFLDALDKFKTKPVDGIGETESLDVSNGLLKVKSMGELSSSEKVGDHLAFYLQKNATERNFKLAPQLKNKNIPDLNLTNWSITSGFSGRLSESDFKKIREIETNDFFGVTNYMLGGNDLPLGLKVPGTLAKGLLPVRLSDIKNGSSIKDFYLSGLSPATIARAAPLSLAEIKDLYTKQRVFVGNSVKLLHASGEVSVGFVSSESLSLESFLGPLSIDSLVKKISDTNDINFLYTKKGMDTGLKTNSPFVKNIIETQMNLTNHDPEAKHMIIIEYSNDSRKHQVSGAIAPSTKWQDKFDFDTKIEVNLKGPNNIESLTAVLSGTYSDEIREFSKMHAEFWEAFKSTADLRRFHVSQIDFVDSVKAEGLANALEKYRAAFVTLGRKMGSGEIPKTDSIWVSSNYESNWAVKGHLVVGDITNIDKIEIEK